MPFPSFREFIEQVEKAGDLLRIEGADRETDIGALTEIISSGPKHPMLLFDKIKGYPPGFRVSPDNLLIKLETQNLSTLISQLEDIWGEFSTDPFKHNFVDEAFATAYTTERRFSSLIGSFTIIAIVISIVGLFGLITPFE